MYVILGNINYLNNIHVTLNKVQKDKKSFCLMKDNPVLASIKPNDKHVISN